MKLAVHKTGIVIFPSSPGISAHTVFIRLALQIEQTKRLLAICSRQAACNANTADTAAHIFWISLKAFSISFFFTVLVFALVFRFTVLKRYSDNLPFLVFIITFSLVHCLRHLQGFVCLHVLLEKSFRVSYFRYSWFPFMGSVWFTSSNLMMYIMEVENESQA